MNQPGNMADALIMLKAEFWCNLVVMIRAVSEQAYMNYRSRVLSIGGMLLGGHHPVRVQSMTNTSSLDLPALLAQCLELWEAGCELIRIASPSLKEARILRTVRKQLHDAGCQIPLCADIHFLPGAALEAARHVEKIRINPGNYVDRPSTKNQTPAVYEALLDLARENLTPLIQTCKEHGTVIRIGVNHGSLSSRILHAYGNTPEGMVASAMEFIQLCEDLDFHSLVISMKASSVGTTVRSTRLLAAQLKNIGSCYPLHLGVTEAGEGGDGRCKSYAGIGTLLGEGLGDTIRVSLTEDPVAEIPVAKALVLHYAARRQIEETASSALQRNPFSYHKRPSQAVEGIGGNHPPMVIVSSSSDKEPFIYPEPSVPPDFVHQVTKDHPDGFLVKMKGDGSPGIPLCFPSYNLNTDTKIPRAIVIPAEATLSILEKINLDNVIIIKELSDDMSPDSIHHCISVLDVSPYQNPFILKVCLDTSGKTDPLLYLTSIAAPLLIDGLIDGLWLEGKEGNKRLLDHVFSLLQVCERRTTRATYISCPSCGRTNFDIQRVLKEVKMATSHLSHLRLAVMGCVVNGPGEMVGSDYGYVGSGRGKINLYKGQALIMKNIPQHKAVEALISLIREHGDWREP